VKAATVALRPALPAVVAAEVVALTAFVALPPHRAGWWPATLISVAALTALVITVHRRNAPGWVAAWARYRRRRRRPVPVAAAVDVPHGGIVCGVRVDAHEAVTMICVTGREYAPTLLRGSTRSLTTNALPLDVLASLLDQPGGIRLAGIDVVNSGQRVRRAEGYPPLYSTLLADRPAAGRRDTKLIVRLDITGSAGGLSYRSSIGAAAAATTERIINALRQNGIRATALSAADMDAALADLSAGLVAPPTRPDTGPEEHSVNQRAQAVAAGSGYPSTPSPQTRWRSVHTTAGYLSNYYFSPEDITTAGLNAMWALRSDAVVQTTSLWKDRRVDRDRGAAVLISAMVRTSDPQLPPQPPTLTLNTLPGEQYAAILRAIPAAGPRITLPARRLDDADPIDIPIGATGILVGAALADDPGATPETQADDLVMLSLTDADRATRISMDTSDFYVRQLLIRAAAVGERIAIYSLQPGRWESLTQPNIAVAERRRPPAFVPTITVNDRPTALSAAGLSATVITLGPAADAGAASDLRFVQTSQSTVRIGTPTQELDVAIVAFRQEQAWMGLT
jgi:type VII secretion protein EccE